MCKKQWKTFHSDIWRKLMILCTQAVSTLIQCGFFINLLRQHRVLIRHLAAPPKSSVSSWLLPLTCWLLQPTLCQRPVIILPAYSSIWSHPRQNLQARALLSIGAQTVGKNQCHTGLDGLLVYGGIWRKCFLYFGSYILMLKLHAGYYSINAVYSSKHIF